MIKVKNEEQVRELAARCIYLLSGLRSFQRDDEETRAIATIFKNKDTELWEIRADEFLKNIECVEFKSLKELIEELKINSNA